jgi:hypothetical protein
MAMDLISCSVLAQLSPTTGIVIGVVGGAAAAIVALTVRARMAAASTAQRTEQMLTNAKQEADNIIKSAEVDAKAAKLASMEAFEKESAAVRAEHKDIERTI